MTFRTLIAALLVLSTAACAQSPAPRQDKAAAAVPAAGSAQRGLTEQVLYQFLLGEIAGQRGELTLASDAYLDLALKTHDARIARRAAEVSIYARKPANALKAAKLWLDLEPESDKARQTYVSLLIGAGRLADAKPYLEALLKQEGRTVGESFLQLPGLVMRYQDKQAVYALVRELAGAYSAVPEASFAVAQVAWHAGQYDATLQALDQALELKPGWEAAALFKGQALQRKGDEAAGEFWRAFLAQHPGAREVRLAHARLLARMGQFPAAKGEFETLLGDMPNNADIHTALGLLAMQMNDLDAADLRLREALRHSVQGQDQVRMYLGQLAEGRSRYEEALGWYRAIAEGQHQFSARLRAAVVLGKLGRVDEGRQVLAALSASTDAEKTQLFQAEAQMLREARDFEAVYATLDRGLQAMPDSQDLLYDRAMAAEKLGRLDQLEKDLRRLIEINPEHAHAYNALGYTLADRTPRLAEAIELLDKALKLAPEDPFILDSMGWALFKAMRLDEAVNYLKRAYAARPDPEIAAHLGEALWVKGDRDEARRVWQGSLKDHPDNDSLRETLGRLQP